MENCNIRRLVCAHENQNFLSDDFGDGDDRSVFSCFVVYLNEPRHCNENEKGCERHDARNGHQTDSKTSTERKRVAATRKKQVFAHIKIKIKRATTAAAEEWIEHFHDVQWKSSIKTAHSRPKISRNDNANARRRFILLVRLC